MKTIRVRRAAVALALPALFACSDVPGAPQGGRDATLFISADVTATTAGVTIEVSAADFDQPVLVSLPVTAGQASGTITIPAGAERTFTARAFDKGGIETHRGSRTLDVVEGDNAGITIVLEPLYGNQPIVVTFASYTVTMSLSNATIEIGGTVQLTAAVQNASGPIAGARITWGSTNPGIATVDQTGLVTAGLVAGTTTIVASYLGAAASVLVTVNPPPTGPTMVEKIVFANGTFDDMDLYMMNPDGTGVTQLTSGTTKDIEPDISPDGQRILFSRIPWGSSIADLWVMNVDGTNPVPLTKTDIQSERCPAWSPDGTRIAFLSDYEELYVMDSDGTNAKLIPLSFGVDCPRWSPDGRDLVIGGIGLGFVSVDTPVDSLFVSTAYGFRGEVDWSAGGFLAVMAAPRNTSIPTNVMLISPDFASMQFVTNRTTIVPVMRRPRFSPEGSRITFEWGAEVWVINADGTNAMNLTAGLAADEADPTWGLVRG